VTNEELSDLTDLDFEASVNRKAREWFDEWRTPREELPGARRAHATLTPDQRTPHWMEWTQKGFALISDVFPAGERAPLLHKFDPARWGVEYAMKNSDDLPDRLKLNLRIVEAEMHFDDGTDD
jgi:hypothetical protein